MKFEGLSPSSCAFYVRSTTSGDNSKGFTPKLNGSTSPVEVMTDGTGKANVLLSIQGAKGGDNFVIEASPGDSAFKCASSCAHSATFEAWKRVYVEVEKMFRRGSLVAAKVLPGDTEIKVRDATRFTGASRVRLIHAPPPDGTGEFYAEIRKWTTS